MDEEKIQSWTSEELIRKIYHELNQNSSIALGILEVLFNEDAFGFVNADQKRLLERLKKELDHIHALNDAIRVWMIKSR
ncbi:MAG TPA: hypothetical protein VI451_03390 [Anaerolineales bacterium]|nr:hypothetical protein [Anaerolineales bacterium]